MQHSFISSSDIAIATLPQPQRLRRKVHPFILRLLVMTGIAFGILALAETAFLYACNELYSLNTVTTTRDDILFGSAFGQAEFGYKLRRAESIKPDIVTLGSSRANQFRSFMMPAARFYNAAGAAQSFAQAYRFMRDLYAVHKPRLVVLTVDSWWFRPNKGLSPDEESLTTQDSFNYRNLVANSLKFGTDPKFLRSLIAHPVNRLKDPLAGRTPVGYRASRIGEGYRPDGSHQYENPEDKPYYRLEGYGYTGAFTYYKRLMNRHIGRFSYAGALDPNASSLVREFVALNRRNGADTILVLPPIATDLYEYARALGDQGRFFADVETELKRLGQELGVEVYDFHELSRLGVADNQTVDGIHADEFSYLTMTDRIAHEGRVLAKYIDVNSLGGLLIRVRDPSQRFNFHVMLR